MSPLPTIAPKWSSHNGTKSNPKSNLPCWQFLLSPEVPSSEISVPWKEWWVSPPQVFPAVEPGSKGCDAPGQGSGDCKVHRFMVQPPRASGAWTPGRGQLMRCGSAGSIQVTQFLVLTSHFPSPSVCRTFLMVSFGNASFWWVHQVYAHLLE